MSEYSLWLGTLKVAMCDAWGKSKMKTCCYWKQGELFDAWIFMSNEIVFTFRQLLSAPQEVTFAGHLWSQLTTWWPRLTALCLGEHMKIVTVFLFKLNISQPYLHKYITVALKWMMPKMAIWRMFWKGMSVLEGDSTIQESQLSHRWPEFHRSDRYVTSNLVEARKKPVF